MSHGIVALFPFTPTPLRQGNERKLLRGEGEGRQCATMSPGACSSAPRWYTQWTESPLHSGLVGRSPATLKKRIPINFQIQGTYGQPDFVFVSDNVKMIIDTKYKRKYQQEKYQAEDIRQLSGYARDTKVLSKLGYITVEEQDKVIDCLIIYPDQNASEKLSDNLKANQIRGFTKFYKMAVKLPVISA